VTSVFHINYHREHPPLVRIIGFRVTVIRLRLGLLGLGSELGLVFGVGLLKTEMRLGLMSSPGADVLDGDFRGHCRRGSIVLQ